MPHKYRVVIICNVVAGSTNIYNIVDVCIIVVAIRSISIMKETVHQQNNRLLLMNFTQFIHQNMVEAHLRIIPLTLHNSSVNYLIYFVLNDK